MESDYGQELLLWPLDDLPRPSSLSREEAARLFPCSVNLHLAPSMAKRQLDNEGSRGLKSDEGESAWKGRQDDAEDPAAREGTEGARRAEAEAASTRPLSEASSRGKRRLSSGSRGRATSGHRPSKRRPAKKRTYGNGLAAFYETVLAWPAEAESLSSRSALGLPPLSPLHHHGHHSDVAFYAAVEELAVEEARCALAQAMLEGPKGKRSVPKRRSPSSRRSSNTALPLELHQDILSTSRSPLVTVKFTIQGPLVSDLQREATCPGWVLALQPLPSPQVPSGSPGSWPHDRAGPSPLVLAAVLGGAEGFLEAYLPAVSLSPGSPRCKAGASWQALPLASVIVQQRQAAVAFCRPAPAFLYRLLGSAGPKHTKFLSSDSSDDGGDPTEPATGHRVAVSGGGAAKGTSEYGSSGQQQRQGKEQGLGGDGGEDAVHGSTTSDSDSDADTPVSCDPAMTVLNRAQSIAMERCLAAKEGSLELVQGPPGCGKTAFLAQLVAGLLAAGRHRVLVTAPSNKAVVVALAACVAAMPGRNAEDFVVLGVEEALLASAESEEQRALVSSLYIYSKAHHLTAGLAAIVSKLSQLLGGLPDRSLGSGLSGTPGNLLSQGLCSESDTRWLVRISHTTECAKAADELSRLVRSAHRLCELLSECVGGDASGSLARAIQRLTDLSYFIAASSKDWPCFRRKKLPELAERALSALAAATESVSRAAEPTDDAAARTLLSSAKCVFCTLGSAGGALLRASASVEVLLVDEAGQALEGDLVLALVARPKCAVLIGDPAQLPATLLSQEAVSMGRARSSMERLMAGGAAALLLDTQYRMHPEIALFPNSLFYGNTLCTSPAVLRRPWLGHKLQRALDANGTDGGGKWRLSPYCIVDTVGREAALPSIANHAEARVAALLAANVLRPLAQQSQAVSVQIICFYKAQVEAVSCALRGLKVSPGRCPVATVDSFQGSEADICVVSMGRCNARGNVGFVKDKQRLNVALTRARHALLVVCSAETLETSDSPELRALISDARQRCCLHSSAEVVAAMGWRVSGK